MSNLQLFGAYAAAFEETLQDDDWSRLEQYFSEEAIYLPGDGTQDHWFAALKGSVENLERKVDTRTLLEEPVVTEDGDTITLKFKLQYTKAGLPDLVLVGAETIQYKDGVIHRIEDAFENAEELISWREQL